MSIVNQTKMKTYSHKSFQEFIESIPQTARRTMRSAYLHTQKIILERDIRIDLDDAKRIASRLEWMGEVALDVRKTNTKLNKLKQINAQLEAIKYKRKPDVTEFDIIEARIKHLKDVLNFDPMINTGNGRFKVACPFHEDKTPSCVLYPHGKGFYCFGCNKGGDTIQFVMDYMQLDFIKAVKFINKTG